MVYKDNLNHPLGSALSAPSLVILLIFNRKGELFGIRNLLRVTGGEDRSCLTENIEKRHEEMESRLRARVSLSVAENEIEEDTQDGGDARDPFNIGIDEELSGNIVYTHLNNLVVGGSRGEEHLSRRVKYNVAALKRF